MFLLENAAAKLFDFALQVTDNCKRSKGGRVSIFFSICWFCSHQTQTKWVAKSLLSWPFLAPTKVSHPQRSTMNGSFESNLSSIPKDQNNADDSRNESRTELRVEMVGNCCWIHLTKDDTNELEKSSMNSLPSLQWFYREMPNASLSLRRAL